MTPVQWQAVPLASFLLDKALADPVRYYSLLKKHPVRFFFSPDENDSYRVFFAQWDQDDRGPVPEADSIIRGTLKFFSHHHISSGFPPDWHVNPMTFEHIPSVKHWSHISEFAHGDVKIIWEMSRFSFVYTLVRAYWRSLNESYPEAFWKAVESWGEANPPNFGVNWKCGQEISFRVMAWICGLYGFLNASATTPARVAFLAQMIAASGQRISGNIDYALSQRNNHGISEAMGLWTIGLLFPEFRDACKWKEQGREYLEREGKKLIYDDGAFSQHSLNYQRMMLHDYLWALRLGELSGCPLSDGLKERVQVSGEFLYQLQDQVTGLVPNYGQNDGALILPLTNCGYDDFRPVVQAVRFYFSGKRTFEPGPWDEELLWMFGIKALLSGISIQERTDLSAGVGGYYTLRSQSGFAFLRCASFKDRPGQADMLHADIWWRGRNVAVDAGTYSYNAPAPWNNALAGTAHHNIVMVDGHDQMERVGRFLWLPWLRGWVRQRLISERGNLSYWEGEHDGYHRLKEPVTYRRGIVRIGPEHWLVLDDLSSLGMHEYRLHWLLTDAPHLFYEREGVVILDFEGYFYAVKMGGKDPFTGLTLIRADLKSPRGWISRHYYERSPALSVAATVNAQKQLFYSVFGPEPFNVVFENSTVHVESGNWKCRVDLSKPDEKERDRSRPLVKLVFMNGSINDQLCLV